MCVWTKKWDSLNAVVRMATPCPKSLHGKGEKRIARNILQALDSRFFIFADPPFRASGQWAAQSRSRWFESCIASQRQQAAAASGFERCRWQAVAISAPSCRVRPDNLSQDVGLHGSAGEKGYALPRKSRWLSWPCWVPVAPLRVESAILRLRCDRLQPQVKRLG